MKTFKTIYKIAVSYDMKLGYDDYHNIYLDKYYPNM